MKLTVCPCWIELNTVYFMMSIHVHYIYLVHYTTLIFRNIYSIHIQSYIQLFIHSIIIYDGIQFCSSFFKAFHSFLRSVTVLVLLYYLYVIIVGTVQWCTYSTCLSVCMSACLPYIHTRRKIHWTLWRKICVVAAGWFVRSFGWLASDYNSD